MAQQSSRLNRLLTLLDTGSTQATRFAAARQIGDIARSHPQDLSSLLKKVSQYLHSKKWDTRVAAAHAIGAIAQNVKQTSLTDLIASVQTKMSGSGVSGTADDLVVGSGGPSHIFSSGGFRSFDISKVLEFGALLASGGQEFDITTDNLKNPRERLARQKKNLQRRLGLDVCEQFMDVNDMIKDEDLDAQRFYTQGNGYDNKLLTTPSMHSIQQFVAAMVPSAVSRKPSARQLNALKRKAKTNSKDLVKSWPEERDTEAPFAQSRTPRGSKPDPFSSIQVDADEDYSEHDGDTGWPFQCFVEQLILDMFDPVWEIRHGSVMALREILAHHGGSAGVVVPEMCSDNILDELRHMDFSDVVQAYGRFDLNMQVLADVSEPQAKRGKFEDGPSVFVDTVVRTSNIANLDPGLKADVTSGNIPTWGVSEQIDLAVVKVDPDSNTRTDSHSVEPTDCDDHKALVVKPDARNDVLKNQELMKLLKLARFSWTKNCEFLQECAVRFLCVLSLDRFGDYISDQVVAPVRETCAQALGAAFKYMHSSLVYGTLNILLQMQRRPEWEIRHGSLLGIKYLVAVRQEMLPHLLGYVLPACKAGLEDCDDDVRAVAADALIPAASLVVSLRDGTLHAIIMLLWDILLELDDLSPSTSSVMNLLAEIYSQEEMMPKMTSKEDHNLDLNKEVHADDAGEGRDLLETPYMLSTLAPRLWPFMRHTITSVRHSAIRTLERLLEAGYKRSLSEPSNTSFWPSFILGDTLRIVFQNLLLESNEEILQCSERVWKLLVQCPVEDLEAAASLYMSSWIELASTPYGSLLDSSKMFWPVTLPRKSHFKAAAKMRAANSENDSMPSVNLDPVKQNVLDERNVDGSGVIKIVVGADAEMSVTNTRVITASALGIFASKLREGPLQFVRDPLWSALTSLSGVQRQISAMIIISWFKEFRSKELCQIRADMRDFCGSVENCLLNLLSCTDPSFPTKGSLLPYLELSRTYGKMRNEASHLLNSIKSSGVFDHVLPTIGVDVEKLTPDAAINLTSNVTSLLNDSARDESLVLEVAGDIESPKQQLLATSSYLKCVQSNLHVTVTALVAAAFVWMAELPVRLNPIILPLMASIKREQEEVLQLKAADALSELIYRCTARRPSPNDKLVKNICSLTCMDPSETPRAAVISSMEVIDDLDFLLFGSSTGKPKSKVHALAGGEDRSRAEGFISRRGAELALKHLCQKFGGSLFDKLPKVWDCLTEVLIPGSPVDEQQMGRSIGSVTDPQILIDNIQVVRSITPFLDEMLKSKLLTLLPCIFLCLRHAHIAVRLAASRCITSMAKSMTCSVMAAIIENAIPMLGDATSVNARQGAGMLISLLVPGLGMEMVQYAPLLVVPLLRCMSDCDPSVRQSVTRSFAALVPLLPLARGLPPPT